MNQLLTETRNNFFAQTFQLYLNRSILISFLMLAPVSSNSFSQAKQAPPVFTDNSGKLIYSTDSLGNRIPDFSWCGYMAGEKHIPDVPAKIFVPLSHGDATNRIQAALDYVAGLPSDNEGIKGAVLLDTGVFDVSGTLHISCSGVTIRGSGTGKHRTTILGSGSDRSTLIIVSGKNDKKQGSSYRIVGSYLPVNTRKLLLSSSEPFTQGDKVIIFRPSTQNWIEAIHADKFGGESGWLRWKPGTREIYWDRNIESLKGDTVILDVPLTTAIDAKYGGGVIAKYEWPGRISQVGIENLNCCSTYDSANLKDEDHRWMAITMENVMDAWVRQVSFSHFAGAAVALYESTKQITVEDCKSLSPVSETGGARRNTFFTSGQQVLFQRCYAEYGYHDFATGYCTAGPTAFVQCESYMPYSFSGPVDSWSSGVLFDNVSVDGQALRFTNLREKGQGTGWNAANSVFWQCAASEIECFSPPTATNWAIGCWATFSGDGHWYECDDHVRPRSLYYYQLADRIGTKIMKSANLLPVTTEACTSPTIEQAAFYVIKATGKALTLSEWIDQAYLRTPLPARPGNLITVDQLDTKNSDQDEYYCPVKIIRGRLVCDDALLTGGRIRNAFWKGSIRPLAVERASPHITRFVPGRNGTGYTDNLDEVIEWMKNEHITAFEHHYGLWYDRRRDDHERIRRIDGDVWPPFYELPFSRSGEGTAWDGLSRYDLMKYNKWYWKRLKSFANLADQNGLILIHQNYFQHNILEAGAHWADFPWRTVNNTNQTGFAEPPPYAGDKRIFMAEQFYDMTHPVRRQIHEAYIRKCLDNFKDNTNVIQSVSAEFTGPLSFTKFWIDVVSEWQIKNNKNILVSLSTPKDVQDSILADPVRSAVIDIIDIRYWQYREDGSLYAPGGGKNLAPRQFARLVSPGETSFDQVYRAVSEYREKFPEKAVLYSFNSIDKFGWAVLMAGGSIPDIPVLPDKDMLHDAIMMDPVVLPGMKINQYAIGNDSIGYVFYNNTSKAAKIDLTDASDAKIILIDPENGFYINDKVIRKDTGLTTIPNPYSAPVIAWIRK